MPFSWMILYVQLFLYAITFIPFMGIIVGTCALWLPFGPEGESFFKFHILQLFSYSFVHGGLLSLSCNLFGIYTCTQVLEYLWGEKRFLFFYIVCATGTGLVQLLVSWLTKTGGMVMGSAGPMFGALTALILLDPDARIDPPWLPKMQITTFALGLTLITLLIGRYYAPFLIYMTHILSGALIAWLLLSYWRWKEPLFADNTRDEEED